MTQKGWIHITGSSPFYFISAVHVFHCRYIKEESMSKPRIWVSKDGTGKTLYVELSVYRNGSGLTISCPDDKEFKFYANENGLMKFRDKIERLFEELVEGKVA